MAYQPMSITELAKHMVDRSETDRWRLVAEFLEESRWESPQTRQEMLAQEPSSTGDAKWDVFLAAMSEHLCDKDDVRAPDWTANRVLPSYWFPFNTKAARVDAIVHAPAAFRRRGIFVAPQELSVA